MSTFATLLVVPSIFALVLGRREFRSPSIYPDDRDSAHYDPRAFDDEAGVGHDRDIGRPGESVAHNGPADHDDPSPAHSNGNPARNADD